MTRISAPRPRLVTARFLLVVMLGLAYFMSLGMLLPVLPLYVKHALGGDSVAVGVAVGAFAAGAVVLRPVAGRLGDRHGRRLLIVGGASIVAAAAALYVASHALATLVAARVFGGVGEAAFFVGAGTMITDLAPVDRRGEAISYWSVAVYGGLAFGPLLGETLLDGHHYSRVWLVSAALAGLGALLGVAARDVADRHRPDPQARRAPLWHRAALAPGSVLFLGLVGLAGFTTFVPLYVGHVGLANSGGVFLLYGGVILAVRIFGARLPDRIGPLRAGTAATSLGAAGLVVIAAWPRALGLLVGTAIFASGISLLYPALLTLALTGVSHVERASVVGTFSSFFDASQGLGALLLGGVAAFAGYRGAFAGGAALCLGGLILLRSGIDARTRAPVDHAAARVAAEVLEPEQP